MLGSCEGKRLEVDEKLQSGTHPQQPSPPAPIADEGATSGTSPQDPVTKCQQFIIRVERLSEKRISERISNRKRPLPDKEEEKAQTPDEEDTTTGDGDRNYDEAPLPGKTRMSVHLSILQSICRLPQQPNETHSQITSRKIAEEDVEVAVEAHAIRKV